MEEVHLPPSAEKISTQSAQEASSIFSQMSTALTKRHVFLVLFVFAGLTTVFNIRLLSKRVSDQDFCLEISKRQLEWVIDSYDVT